METFMLCHQHHPFLLSTNWHSLIRDLSCMEATFIRLFKLESVSAQHSHTQARVLIVGWLSEAWSQLREVMTLTGAASHCDLDKQRWSAVYVWLEVQCARVVDSLDYSEQTCPLVATWYNVMSPSAMWTQHAESWPGLISPGDGLFCIFVMNSYCFHSWWRLLTTSNWLTLKEISNCLQKDLKEKKERHLGKKRKSTLSYEIARGVSWTDCYDSNIIRTKPRLDGLMHSRSRLII